VQPALSENVAVKKIIAALLLLSSAPACAAGSSTPWAMGGNYSRFDPVVAQYNASGELFRIQGHCQSSCTLFLAIRSVCIEPSATLLFHSAHDRQRNVSPALTQHMLAAYNAPLREYVTANRFMDTLAFHSISGRDMIRRFGYRQCPR
jgi:hypothetical protein